MKKDDVIKSIKNMNSIYGKPRASLYPTVLINHLSITYGEACLLRIALSQSIKLSRPSRDQKLLLNKLNKFIDGSESH